MLMKNTTSGFLSRLLRSLGLIMATIWCAGLAAAPITYQGQLQQQDQPFSGTATLEFRLFDSVGGATQIGPVQTRDGVNVQNGVFQVELDFGAGAFDGSARFLEVRVNGTPLTPRQAVTATPQALIATSTIAGAIGASQINPAQVQQRVTTGCPVGQYLRIINQNGTAVCGTDDAGWRLGGNAGTNPNGNFIGTTDSQALEFRTQNVRNLRIEPSVFQNQPITTNIIAGSHANEVRFGLLGATISGGGAPEGSLSFYTAGGPNRIGFDFGTVGGGLDNEAGRDAPGEDNVFATVGGGLSNRASNFGSTISGGVGNIASGPISGVSGGSNNTASGSGSTISGGRSNTASVQDSSVGGGSNNTASGVGSIVAGGLSNRASGLDSIVAGGAFNTAAGTVSAVGGGLSNCAGGNYSWAGGRRAKVRPASNPGSGSCSGLTYPGGEGDAGSFIWADSTNEDFVSQRSNQFRVRANGGAEFQTGVHGLVAFSNSSASAGAAIQGESVHPDGIAITGRNESTDATLVLNNRGTGRLIRAFRGGTVLMQLENNGDLFIAGALTQNSDRDQKEGIQSVDAQSVLDRLSELQISSWRYLNGDDGVRHIGPMAQDFHAAFGFGVSETTISTVDAQGIAFAAIQALNQRLLESQAEVAVLKIQSGQMRELAERNAELERRLSLMEARAQVDAGLAERLATLEDLLLSAAPAVAAALPASSNAFPPDLAEAEGDASFRESHD